MIRRYRLSEIPPEEILCRDIRQEKDVGEAVDAIISAVRREGDAAVRRFTEQFDGCAIDALEVPRDTVETAWQRIDPALYAAMTRAAENIRAFHVHQKHEGFMITGRSLKPSLYRSYMAFFIATCSST